MNSPTPSAALPSILPCSAHHRTPYLRCELLQRPLPALHFAEISVSCIKHDAQAGACRLHCPGRVQHVPDMWCADCAGARLHNRCCGERGARGDRVPSKPSRRGACQRVRAASKPGGLCADCTQLPAVLRTSPGQTGSDYGCGCICEDPGSRSSRGACVLLMRTIKTSFSLWTDVTSGPVRLQDTISACLWQTLNCVLCGKSKTLRLKC